MAAPATDIAVHDPDGIHLDDGYQTLISFAVNPQASFWEKSVKPPGMDGGDPIDTTTMHNQTWRTMAPRQLVSMTELNLTVAYDPVLYDAATVAGSALNLLNQKTTVNVTFPDGSVLAFYGFMRSFDPTPLEEGAQPEATMVVVVTNQDPSTGEEEDPVLVNRPST